MWTWVLRSDLHRGRNVTVVVFSVPEPGGCGGILGQRARGLN